MTLCFIWARNDPIWKRKIFSSSFFNRGIDDFLIFLGWKLSLCPSEFKAKEKSLTALKLRKVFTKNSKCLETDCNTTSRLIWGYKLNGRWARLAYPINFDQSSTPLSILSYGFNLRTFLCVIFEFDFAHFKLALCEFGPKYPFANWLWVQVAIEEIGKWTYFCNITDVGRQKINPSQINFSTLIKIRWTWKHENIICANMAAPGTWRSSQNFPSDVEDKIWHIKVKEALLWPLEYFLRNWYQIEAYTKINIFVDHKPLKLKVPVEVLFMSKDCTTLDVKKYIWSFLMYRLRFDSGSYWQNQNMIILTQKLNFQTHIPPNWSNTQNLILISVWYLHDPPKIETVYKLYIFRFNSSYF